MSTYEPIASQTLSSAASSVVFSSIPQNYTDLVLVVNCAISSGTGNSKIQFNSDTGSNYSETTLEGTGSSAVSGRYSNNTSIILEGSGFLSTTFSTVKIIQIQNYNNGATNKTCLIRNGSAGAGVDAIVGLWRNTSAINSITLSTTASTFVSGSTFTIYGVSAGNSSAKATGGNIVVTDGSYWYHAFTTTGTFTPSTALTADILCVAGGGGGGYISPNGFHGGGGAGGLLGFSSQSLTSSVYSVVVGAGGNINTSGNNSKFGTLTSAVGGGAGGQYQVLASTGGSGGGGAEGSGWTDGAVGTSGQGNSGGNGAGGSTNGGGGGGGAGGAGSNASGSGGNGGIGATYTTTVGGSAGPYSFINAMATATGTGQLVSGNYYYAGGGGGSADASAPGTGGSGGGGVGADYNTSPGGRGLANTGSGGGGGAGNQTGGNGGSGIIIVRYAV